MYVAKWSLLWRASVTAVSCLPGMLITHCRSFLCGLNATPFGFVPLGQPESGTGCFTCGKEVSSGVMVSQYQVLELSPPVHRIWLLAIADPLCCGLIDAAGGCVGRGALVTGHVKGRGFP